MKTLYFEGAGWSDAESSKATVGNCRIRTAFHTMNGEQIYLEMSCVSVDKYCKSPLLRAFAPYAGLVTYCYKITNDSEDCNKNNLIKRFLNRVDQHEPAVTVYGKVVKPARTTARYEIKPFFYTKEGILSIVKQLDGDFDQIEVLPDLGGYRVFRDNARISEGKGYNFGDEFTFDPELLRCRQAVYDYIYQLERKEIWEDRIQRTGKFSGGSRFGEEYPTFSLWVDEEEQVLLHLLRHFNGYNKHWKIRIDVKTTVDDWIADMKETTLGKYGC